MTFRFDSATCWRAVVANSPHLVLFIDRDAKIRFDNRRGIGPSLGPMSDRPLYDFLSPEFRATARDRLRAVLADRQPAEFEAEFMSPEEDRTLCTIWLAPLIDDSGDSGGSGDVAGLTLCVQDISEVRATRWELARQKNVLSAIIDSLADGVAVVDADGQFLVYNRAAERLIGVNPQDVRPEDWSRHFGLYRTDKVTRYDVQDLPLTRAAAGERAENVELYVRNPGKPRGVFLSVNASPLVDVQQRHQGGVAVFRDVTAEKEAAEKLQSEQRLLRKLLDLQESDRRMIAHEIHDGFVQEVVGAKMLLEAAKARVPPELGELAEPLRQATELLRNAIKEARRMISDVRPLVIDEQGIVEAIRHLIADYKTQRGLEVQFKCDEDIPVVDGRLKGAVYRIVQEAVNNISHHAQTERAHLEIRHHQGILYVEVRDEGIGFDQDCVSPERFGLRGIRERARLFGGHATIESRPGQGTTVRAELPTKPTLATHA